MSKFQFSDPTDAMAGSSYRSGNGQGPSGIVLFFKHVATGITCEFKAFLTEFEDGFESDWEESDIWGRMDDVQTFKKTKRKISISWTVPSHSQEEAISNFNEVAKMNTMVYPVYEDLQNGPQGGNFQNTPDTFLSVEDIRQNLLSIQDANNAGKISNIQGALQKIQDSILSSAQDGTDLPIPNQQISLLSSPPIIQMKFMNWVSDSNDDGLYGKLSDFKFKPNLEEGVFIQDGLLIPMTCECSVNFTVIHTDKLGWDRNKQKRTTSFPYQLDKVIK